MFYNKPIPMFKTVEGWKEHLVIDNDETLVSLKELNHNKLLVRPMYFIDGIDGSINDCYVRESVLNKLLEATTYLPDGYKFVIWDTWRPVEVQKALFDLYKQKFAAEQPQLNEKELLEYTQKYVSLPSTDLKKPSPHITGGAVDLSIMDKENNYLEMGTKFDEMTERSLTRYFEIKLEKGEKLRKEEELALRNRRLLFHVMTTVGFTNYFEEWWHYDFGNQFWGTVSDKPSFYSYTFPE